MILSENLTELRKNHGFSQEELAEKLDVSRQAISKWERGEASPDTENLIALARLYGVSLDALVGLSPDTPATEPIPAPTPANTPEPDKNPATKARASGYVIVYLVAALLAMIIFFLLGTVFRAWEISWTVFILIPVAGSVADCIRKHSIEPFLYPVFIAFLYVLLGMIFSLWHPGWILFLTIPIYYTIVDHITKS